ncbi:hypothetical protein [Pseudonocardia humida]|uniref:LysM domain-containing protein n=1 Tax=Pseudonocardia humida TaxID=2800819 RepID=A0ABT1A918_9PSEU|nr:hypothetical protein [Pseudonocardia humida]MCO1659512.1 hypothetical protein [Pseudonocardia humida]
MQPARPSSPPVVRKSSALALLGSSLLGAPRRAEQRVLARRALPLSPIVPRAQRLLAALALATATATVVVLFGLLAGAVAESRGGAPAPATAAQQFAATPRSGAPADITVTVGPEKTVWEVAQAVLPSATGPELGALAERIIVDNELSSVRVQPGQVLRVTVG